MDHQKADETIRIDRIISGGDGMSRSEDGCVVFVPRTAPGDLVNVAYTDVHKQWRRARVAELLEPGPGRQNPECGYYEQCGGCQLQHLTYETQLGVKAGIVSDCLTRIGGAESPVVFVDASPREWHYRNRVTFVVRSNAGTVSAGLHSRDDASAVVDVESCPIAEESINNAWTQLRGLLIDYATRGATDLRVTVRATGSGAVGVIVESAHRVESALIESMVAVDSVEAAWLINKRGELLAQAGAETLEEHRAPYTVSLAGTAFLQVNRRAAELLDAYVVGQCSGKRGRHVIDAYSGFGMRSLDIARNGAVVTGIDIDEYSVSSAVSLSVATGVAAAFIAGPVERVMRGHLPADVVVMNPPRKGVDKRVVEALLEKAPERIVYVSCNPATLARDVKLLSDLFAITACRAFDLFPQTAHVETVLTLEKRDA